MELKLVHVRVYERACDSLNRTFYGIETPDGVSIKRERVTVLIVPFMELKLQKKIKEGTKCTRLNRTFYGIETF